MCSYRFKFGMTWQSSFIKKDRVFAVWHGLGMVFAPRSEIGEIVLRVWNFNIKEVLLSFNFHNINLYPSDFASWRTFENVWRRFWMLHPEQGDGVLLDTGI